MKYYIARDKDGSLYKFPYWPGMVATAIPHKHISGYPFDGNFYAEGSDYQLRKGEKIDGSLYPNVTYANSPVLVDD